MIVTLHRGDLPTMVVTAQGMLHHWRSDRRTAFWSGHAREDIVGLYDVGDATFDVTGLHDARSLSDAGWPARGLSFALTESDDDATELTVIWGLDEPPAPRTYRVVRPAQSDEPPAPRAYRVVTPARPDGPFVRERFVWRRA